jgi:hypothetical protein
MNTQDPNRRSVLVLLGALTLFVALLSSASPALRGLASRPRRISRRR